MIEDRQDDDESLMVRVQSGDHQAFATLVQRHTRLFFSAAYRMCAQEQEAEDIVQEAFLKLWDRPDAFDREKGVKFTTWFYRVVTNLAIDKGRKKKPQAGAEILEFLPDGAAASDQVLQERQQEQALEQAIQNLPERQKTALNLCFYEGLSNKDAAEIMGVGVKALESLLIRAKKTLKDDLMRRGLIEREKEIGTKSHAG